MAITPFLNGGGIGNKRRSFKKLFLWTLLIAQLFLIFCFWCMQTTNQERTPNDAMRLKNHDTITMNMKSSVLHRPENSVHFVTKKKIMIARKSTSVEGNTGTLENVSNFTQDYEEVRTYRLMNITGIEAEMDIYDSGAAASVWCYKKGTLNDSIGLLLYWNMDAQQVQCKCESDWHGKDCGQPEIIWRAALLPRNQIIPQYPSKDKEPQLLIYIVEGFFCSLDFLELQLKAVDQVVDYFLILWKRNHAHTRQTQKELLRKLNEILEPSRYFLYHCGDFESKSKCNFTNAVDFFTTLLKTKFQNRLHFSDLLLYTNESVVLCSDALRFFKYYIDITKSTPITWRFRLKYNVYGFYWQHPRKTHISGFLSSFGQFVDSIKQQKQYFFDETDDFRILGDLNHVGGWFCQYCQQPDEIIQEMNELQDPKNVPTLIDERQQQQQQIPNIIQLPNGVKNRFVDTKYLEFLIAEGLHIDGITRLEKVRSYGHRNNYFAPSYMEKLKWKFGNLLTNLYEAIFNDYVLEEAEGGIGF